MTDEPMSPDAVPGVSPPRLPGPLTLAGVSLAFLVVHALALAPVALVAHRAFQDGLGHGMWRSLVAALVLTADLALLPVLLVACSGAAGLVLAPRYTGRHPLDFRLPALKRWLLSLAIYFPTAVLLDLFHLYPLKSLHIRCFGGRVARGAVVGGLVTDPSLVEIGAGSIVGGFSNLLGHAVERGEVVFDTIHIGAGCGVGARAVVLPGSVIEDGGLLAAASLLPKGARIPTGATFAGVPARSARVLRGRP